MNIRKMPCGTGYHVGGVWLHRVSKISRSGKGLSQRRMLVTLTNGDVWTLAQLDRDYYEVTGPHFVKPCRVDGWTDGLRLINSI